MADQSLSPVHVSSGSAGKIANDIALTIDAMDLLHSSRVDAFAIVSSDQGYTRRRSYPRRGHAAHGYDPANTSVSFQLACSSPRPQKNSGQGQRPEPVGQAIGSWHPRTRKLIWCRRCFAEVVEKRMWISRLGEYLRRHKPHLDAGVFRCRTLSELVEKLESFDLIAHAVTKMVRLRLGGARNQPRSVPG